MECISPLGSHPLLPLLPLSCILVLSLSPGSFPPVFEWAQACPIIKRRRKKMFSSYSCSSNLLLLFQAKFLFLFLKFYLFTYFWLCWVFVSVRGLSLVAASGGHSSSRCAGLSLSRPLLLQSTGSRRAGSVIVAHGPSCFAACGILPDQGSNPCPLHWQEASQPLHHQGSPPKPNFLRELPMLSILILCLCISWSLTHPATSFLHLPTHSTETSLASSLLADKAI